MDRKIEKSTTSVVASLPPNLDSAIDRCSEPELLKNVFYAFDLDSSFKDTRNFVDALSRHLDACMEIDCLMLESLDYMRSLVADLKKEIEKAGPKVFPRTLDIQGGRRNANELLKYSSARLLTCEPEEAHRPIQSFLVGLLLAAIIDRGANDSKIKLAAKSSRVSLDPIFSKDGRSTFSIQEGRIFLQLIESSSTPAQFLSLSKTWLGPKTQQKNTALTKVLHSIQELIESTKRTKSPKDRRTTSITSPDVSADSIFHTAAISQANEEDSLPLASLVSNAPLFTGESFKPETAEKILGKRGNAWLHSVVDVFVDSSTIYNPIECLRIQRYFTEVLANGDRHQRTMALFITTQIYLAKDRESAIDCTWGSSSTAELHISGQWLRPNPIPDGAFTPEDEDKPLYDQPVPYFYLPLPDIIQELLESLNLPQTNSATLGDLLGIAPNSIDANLSEFVEEMRNATSCGRLRLNGFTNQLVRYTVAKTNRNTAYWIFGGEELGAPIPAYYAASNLKKLCDAYIYLAEAYASGAR